MCRDPPYPMRGSATYEYYPFISTKKNSQEVASNLKSKIKQNMGVVKLKKYFTSLVSP